MGCENPSLPNGLTPRLYAVAGRAGQESSCDCESFGLCDYFLGRHCHNLTYESVQASRSRSEQFFKVTARYLESTTRIARRWFRVMNGGAEHEVKRPMIEKVRDRRTGLALEVIKSAREKGLSI